MVLGQSRRLHRPARSQGRQHQAVSDSRQDGARSPHPRVDKNGDIWFTAQGGNAVGHLSVSAGTIRLIKVPSENARPYGINLDSKVRPWFVEFGTNKIG